MKPNISIITITLNSEKYLEKTILSVINQSYKYIDYIIVDGSSTDGTLEIIKNYETLISKWISEPDKGIADAMNKGLALATGDYILFLHSDDYLINKEIINRAMNDLEDSDFNIFRVYFDKNRKLLKSKNIGLSWYTNFKMGSCHQGQIILKKVFDKVGHFDTKLKINMDYDFLLRAYRMGVRSATIDYPISVMRLTGVSSRLDWEGLKARLLEENLIHYKNCPNLTMYFVYKIYWALYLPYRWVKHTTNKYSFRSLL